ncbi:hypothetical protein CVS40_11013 [Lucilia cuprina]|nr:hypothetical protein CVS40_11013 [Lucilia cuprina]
MRKKERASTPEPPNVGLDSLQFGQSSVVMRPPGKDKQSQMEFAQSARCNEECSLCHRFSQIRI